MDMSHMFIVFGFNFSSILEVLVKVIAYSVMDINKQ